MKDSDCYTFKKLYSTSKPIFKNVDLAVVLTMENSFRKFDDPILLNLAPLTYVQINKGYKNCNKPGVFSTSVDLIHAYNNVCKNTLEYNNVIIFEDDAIFNKKYSIQEFKNVDNFINKIPFDIYSLGSFSLNLPTLSDHKFMIGMIGASQAIICSKNARNTLAYKKDCELYKKNYHIDNDVLSSFYNKYKYKYPLICQTFPETENKKDWENSLSGVVLSTIIKFLNGDKIIEPYWSSMYLMYDCCVYVVRLTIVLIFIIITLFLISCITTQVINNKLESLISTKIVTNPPKINEILKNIPVYIINFSHRKDRKLHITNVMNKLGFENYKFIEPVSENEIIQNYGNKYKISTISRTLTSIKIFNSYKSDKFFIFEDDIDIYNSICSLNDIYNSASKVDYDLLFFEICYTLCENSKRLSNCLFELKEPNCNGAILYTEKFVKKFLTYLEKNFNFNIPIDNIIIDMNKKNLIKCVGFPYFRQNPSLGSEIETSARFNAKNIAFDPLCRLI